MSNIETMTALQSTGRLDIVHVGDKPAAKRPVLKSRRFAMVIDNELHIRKYEDPSHGWLAVPMQWLEQLGIVGKISAFSYRRNSTAYLEEDGDMAEFYNASKNAGYKLFIDYHHTDDRSPVRSYPSFPQKEGAK